MVNTHKRKNTFSGEETSMQDFTVQYPHNTGLFNNYTIYCVKFKCFREISHWLAYIYVKMQKTSCVDKQEREIAAKMLCVKVS